MPYIFSNMFQHGHIVKLPFVGMREKQVGLIGKQLFCSHFFDAENHVTGAKIFLYDGSSLNSHSQIARMYFANKEQLAYLFKSFIWIHHHAIENKCLKLCGTGSTDRIFHFEAVCNAWNIPAFVVSATCGQIAIVTIRHRREENQIRSIDDL